MPAIPRISSSIILLRKTSSSAKSKYNYEVLLAKRSKDLKSFSSFYVFPGGVAETTDDKLAEDSRYCSVPHASLKVTGLRELFEETGVLLQHQVASAFSKPVQMDMKERLRWQELVHDDPTKFKSLLDEKRISLPCQSLAYWVTFITPVIEKRRFNASFFVSVVDSEDDVKVFLDQAESAEYTWKTPEEALQENLQGKMHILPPQFYCLSTIGRFTDVDELLHYAKSKPAPVPILPHAIGMEDDVLTLAYPGDHEHPDYPSHNAAHRNRIHCTVPIGVGGYRVERNCELPLLSAKL